MSANWWEADAPDSQPQASGANWWDQDTPDEAADPRPYDPFVDAPRLPGEEGFQDASSYRQSSMLDRALRYGGEYLSGLLQRGPGIRPPWEVAAGAGETALALGSGLVAPVLGAAEHITLGTPLEEAVRKATYEPRTQAGQGMVRAIGALAKPAIDIAEATGADVALLPLATEAQALGSVARGRKELGQVRAEGKRLTAPPTAQELTQAAKQAYQLAKDAGAVAAPESFSRMAGGLRASLREEGFNPKLHPRASAVIEEIEKAAGGPVSFDDIEILRRQALAAERSIEADERRIASLIVDRLDDYADALASGAEPIVGGNAKTAVEARKQARDLYARSRKSMEIQELIERAKIRASQFSGSGEENALRTEFRQLAMNPKRMRRFTQEEQQAIKEVAFGTPTSNALRQIGKLAPTGGLSQWLSIVAPMLNPLAAVVPLSGAAARVGATSMTRRAAQRAEELMRRGQIRTERPETSQNRFSQLAPEPISGEIMPREPLVLPPPTIISGPRSAPGTAFAREQMGLTPDVERAGMMHPGVARQAPPRAPAALPMLPAREPAPIIVDVSGRAGTPSEMAAYRESIGLQGLRNVRQPRVEPVDSRNLFTQLERARAADEAGAAFDAERASAAEAARRSIEVQELPAQEVVLATPPQVAAQIPSTREVRNALARLAEPIEAETQLRNAAKSAVAVKSERPAKNRLSQLGGERTIEQIEAELKKLGERAQRLPPDEPFDSPRMQAIEREYSALRKELEAARAKVRRAS